MSGDAEFSDGLLTVAALVGLFALTVAANADEPELPDLEFLEYLGSWEESDEDWVLIAAQTSEEKVPGKEDEGNVPAPDGEKLAELDDEH